MVNGKGTGAHSEYGDEGVLAAELRDMVKGRTSGMVVTDTDSMTLSQVVASVNRTMGSGDLAVELHFNAAGNVLANGCEAVVADAAGGASKLYAKKLGELVSGTLGVRNRGVKTESQSARGRLAFVRETRCAAVILEICFLSNKEDMEKYKACKTMLADKLARYFWTL